MQMVIFGVLYICYILRDCILPDYVFSNDIMMKYPNTLSVNLDLTWSLSRNKWVISSGIITCAPHYDMQHKGTPSSVIHLQFYSKFIISICTQLPWHPPPWQDNNTAPLSPSCQCCFSCGVRVDMCLQSSVYSCLK